MPYADPVKRRENTRVNTQRYRLRRRQERTRAVRVARATYMPPPLTVRAWAAGLIEGEGTLTISVNSRWGTTRPVVHMVNTDIALVDRINTYWPGNRAIVQAAGNANVAHVWRIYAQEPVRRIIADLRPFFQSPRSLRLSDLLTADIDARQQGSRGPLYRHHCLARAAVVRVLNHRGTTEFDPEQWLASTLVRHGLEGDAFLLLERAYKLLEAND